MSAKPLSIFVSEIVFPTDCVVSETVALVEQNLRVPGQYLDRESGLVGCITTSSEVTTLRLGGIHNLTPLGWVVGSIHTCLLYTSPSPRDS